jgi:putative flippase GtrA
MLRQFVKFCLVGAASTALNIGLGLFFLHCGFPVMAAHFCAFTIAVTNGFVLNRAWTFRRYGAKDPRHQYVMFVAINVVGAGLSWLIVRGMMTWLLHAQLAHSMAAMIHQWTGHLPRPLRLAFVLGELAATPPVAVWNFSANRLWTFKGVRK